jgi:transketolase
MKAHKKLKEEGIDTNVISLPSWDKFLKQDIKYRRQIIPPQVKARVSIEMGSTLGWEKFVGDYGIAIGIDKFGASAKGDKIIEEYGFTTENVVKQIKSLIEVTGEDRQ